jgi:pSer/pThr/pTyr-binding forkhead associated (FHA) protein
VAPPRTQSEAAAVASAPLSTAPPQAAPTSAPRPPLATLEIINEGVMKGVRFEIRAPLVHVGRGAHNDISIADESVSDGHAKIQKRDAGWIVDDMGSTNGTYVAGQRVQEERQLSGVVDVRFGGVKMLFRPARELDEDAGGTRVIVGLRGLEPKEPERAPIPASPPPVESAGGQNEAPTAISPFVWAAVIVVVAIAILYMLKGR